MPKRKLSVGLFCLSLILLIPGLTEPMITIKASVDKADMLELGTRALFADESNIFGRFANSILEKLEVQGKIEIFEKTRSVTGTIHDLISTGHFIVGILIGLFAVVIPLTKILFLTASTVVRSSQEKYRLRKLSGGMSKWSMADVFVMAIMVGYMAANASATSDDTVRMNAEFGTGFYFFTAYCVVSILASQLLEMSIVNLPEK